MDNNMELDRQYSVLISKHGLSVDLMFLLEYLSNYYL